MRRAVRVTASATANVVGVGGQIDDDGLVQPEFHVLGRRHRGDASLAAIGLAADRRIAVELSTRIGGAVRLQAGAGQQQPKRSGDRGNGPSAVRRRQSYACSHFLAPTSETSPDLISRMVPRLPAPETR